MMPNEFTSVLLSILSWSLDGASYLHFTNRKPNKHSCLADGFPPVFLDNTQPVRCRVFAAVQVQYKSAPHVLKLHTCSCRCSAHATCRKLRAGEGEGSTGNEGGGGRGHYSTMGLLSLLAQLIVSVTVFALFVSVGWLSHLMAGITFCWVRSLAVSLRPRL